MSSPTQGQCPGEALHRVTGPGEIETALNERHRPRDVPTFEVDEAEHVIRGGDSGQVTACLADADAFCSVGDGFVEVAELAQRPGQGGSNLHHAERAQVKPTE